MQRGVRCKEKQGGTRHHAAKRNRRIRMQRDKRCRERPDAKRNRGDDIIPPQTVPVSTCCGGIKWKSKQ
eukprot:scaffold184063_cov14-Tisochrysis_lutea.AAC.2